MERHEDRADPNYPFGFGYGSDMNGLAAQSAPTSTDPITYPFNSYDGDVTFNREVWGQQTFDLNTDGVANYGMYPDWLQELRMLGGRSSTTCSTARRATSRCGSARRACRATTCRAADRGLQLRRASARSASASTRRRCSCRPASRSSRPGTSYRYCVTGRDRANLGVAFNAAGTRRLIGSTAPGHTANGIGPGAPASALTGHATPLSSTLWTSPAGGGARYVFQSAAGKVHSVSVAAASESTAAALTLDLVAAGLD